MRAVFLSLFLAMCCAANAAAEPTYVLFDTSSSVKDGKRLLAIDQAKAIIDGLKPDAELSINYFGGSCDKPTIRTPTPKSENAEFDPPDSGGSTPLGEALEAAYEAASKTGGDIYVYSDGGNYCGKVDICEVSRAYLSAYPNINLHFDPIGPASEDEDKLGCLKSARQPINIAAIPIDPAPEKNDPPPPLPWVGWALLVNGMILAWRVGVFIHVWGGHWVAVEKFERQIIAKKNATDQEKAVEAERAKREAAEAEAQQKEWEALHPKKKYKAPKPDQRHLLKFEAALFAAFWPLVVVLGADLFLFWMFPTSFDQARRELWWFAETSFGSKFLPAVLAGFIGWTLIRIWEITLQRRDKVSDAVMLQIKLDQKAAADARRASYQSKAAAKQAARTKELVEANKVRAVAAHDDFTEEVAALKAISEDQDFDAVAQRVAAIRQRIEAVVESTGDNNRLASYSRTSRENYTPLVSNMQFYRVIPYETARAAIGALSAWSIYASSKGTDASARERIMSFEADRIELPSAT